MIHKHLKDRILYDGTQIRPNWALNELNIKGPSIITWIGPMDIKNIIDYEDRELKIKADKMAHFIVEHFDEQPANLRLCYHRQRMLVMILQEKLWNHGIPTRREGDDLYIGKGKLTVSVATASLSSMKIHLGMNITSKGTPQEVETIGILDYKDLEEDNIIGIIEDVAQKYIQEVRLIEEDITKTKTG